MGKIIQVKELSDLIDKRELRNADMTMRSPWPVMFVLVGLPYTGKTFLRKKLLETKLFRDPLVVSTDDELTKMAAKNGMSYEDVFHHFYSVAKEQAKIEFAWGIQKCQDILIDRTNMSRVARREWMQSAKEHGYVRVALVLQASQEVIEERQGGRTNQVVPMGAINRMRDDYEPPTLAEGFFAVLESSDMETLLKKSSLFLENWNTHTRYKPE